MGEKEFKFLLSLTARKDYSIVFDGITLNVIIGCCVLGLTHPDQPDSIKEIINNFLEKLSFWDPDLKQIIDFNKSQKV